MGTDLRPGQGGGGEGGRNREGRKRDKTKQGKQRGMACKGLGQGQGSHTVD